MRVSTTPNDDTVILSGDKRLIDNEILGSAAFARWAKRSAPTLRVF